MQKHLLSLTLNLLQKSKLSPESLAAHQTLFSNGRAICPPLFPCEGFSWHAGMLYLHRRHAEITLSRQLPKVVGYGLRLDVLCVRIRWKYLEKHRSHTKCHTKWTANIWLEVNIFSAINSCDQLTPNLFQLWYQKLLIISHKFLNLLCPFIHDWNKSPKNWRVQRKTSLKAYSISPQNKDSVNIYSPSCHSNM